MMYVNSDVRNGNKLAVQLKLSLNIAWHRCHAIINCRAQVDLYPKAVDSFERYQTNVPYPSAVLPLQSVVVKS